MEERIERRMKAEGHDLQSDEGANEYQRRLDRELEQSKMIVKFSDGRPSVKFRGIAI